MPNSWLRPCRALLVVVVPVVAILCLGRVVFLAQRYARESLQTDFAAMYFAGASVRAGAGLDPYDNNAARDLKYWDGAARYRHSRYLYPPIVAYALQPIATMPYPAAKFSWTLSSLAVLAAAIVLAIKAAGVRLDATRWLLAVIVMSLLFPILPLLERGQIDAVTLLFVALGFYLIFARRRDLLGGATIAAAGFIKLQCFYLLPLLLVVRRERGPRGSRGSRVPRRPRGPRAAVGMMIGIVVFGIVQLLICGPAVTRQYVVDELPRIARHGEVGSETMRLDSPAIRDVNATLPAGDAVAGGRWQYRYSMLPDYAAMASLVPYVRGVINQVARVRVPSTAVSIPLLLLALATTWFFLRRGVADEDPWSRLAFMGVSLIIVLLTAPITWTSNLVWLAPLVPLIVFGPTPAGARFVRSVALVGLGLLILPDTLAPGLLVRFGRIGEVLGAQYVLAQLLILPYTLTIAAAAGPAAAPAAPAKS